MPGSKRRPCETRAPEKSHPTIGCCGIDCGLCPHYYTVGVSRCPGCAGPSFAERHPTCSILTCCVVRRTLETCAPCEDFPCAKIGTWDLADSFVTHRNCLRNLDAVRRWGLQGFLRRQTERMGVLARMLDGLDDGRAKSFYCLSVSLLPVKDVQRAVAEAERLRDEGGERPRDVAAFLRKALALIAEDAGVELSYRR